MRFGIIGLGRMGANLAQHAAERGHEVVGFSRSVAASDELVQNGIEIVPSPEELVQKLNPPRVILIYVPRGPSTDEVCGSLRKLMKAGDIVCDGGNSHGLAATTGFLRRNGHPLS